MLLLLLGTLVSSYFALRAGQKATESAANADAQLRRHCAESCG